MVDRVAIDWGLTQPQQSLTDTYANAFKAGRQATAQPAIGNAFAPPSNAQLFYDRLRGMPAQQQSAALHRLMLVDAVAQSIKARTQDPVERATIARHIAATQPALGIDPETLTPESLTDDNIDGVHQVVSGASEAIGMTPQT